MKQNLTWFATNVGQYFTLVKQLTTGSFDVFRKECYTLHFFKPKSNDKVKCYVKLMLRNMRLKHTHF